MAEHADLITELQFLEKMNTEERLKLARKRRGQQLKKWSNREREYQLAKRKSRDNTEEAGSGPNRAGNKCHFDPAVMLLEAATRNDTDEVRRLLRLGVSPDSTNEDGLTALHQCCIDNGEEMMQILVEFNANVNAKDSEQWTPLHAAATCGHLHLIKILIEKGADLLAVNADGNMPYDICEDEQTLDYIESEMAKRGITQELIDETRSQTEMWMLDDMRKLAAMPGGDLNYRDENGATPLHIAASNGYLSVIEFLLDNNASTEECDNDLWQPIHAAACWGHIDVLEYLVQNGADLDARTKNGETPFDICEDPDMKQRILQLRSEIEAKRTAAAAQVNQNRALRRSHSQNTRSQSIRRTSIREKSAIAKREAIQEARIWHETQPPTREETDTDSDGQFYSDTNNRAANNLGAVNNEVNKSRGTNKLAPLLPPQQQPEQVKPIELKNIDFTMSDSIDSDLTFQNVKSSTPHKNNGNVISGSQQQPHQQQQSKELGRTRNSSTLKQEAMDNLMSFRNIDASAYGSNSSPQHNNHADSYHNGTGNQSTTPHPPPQTAALMNNGEKITAKSTSGADPVKVEVHITVNSVNQSNHHSLNANSVANNYNAYSNTGNGSAGGGAGSNGGVTGGSGTLMDLKKQREKHRNSVGNNQFVDRRPNSMDYSTAVANSKLASLDLNQLNHQQQPHSLHNQYHHSQQYYSAQSYGSGGGGYNSRQDPYVVAQQPTQISSVSVNAHSPHHPHHPHHHPGMTNFDSPPSPSGMKKKIFRGNPSELIGEESSKKGCCSIC